MARKRQQRVLLLLFLMFSLSFATYTKESDTITSYVFGQAQEDKGFWSRYYSLLQEEITEVISLI